MMSGREDLLPHPPLYLDTSSLLHALKLVPVHPLLPLDYLDYHIIRELGL